MSDVAAIDNALEKLLNSNSIPSELLKSCSFLYSSGRTLTHREDLGAGKDYLLIGYNPGGDPDKIQHSLQEEIDEWKDRLTNAYLDEAWDKSEGQHPYQKSVKALCRSIGVCTREVCATNLIFTRSIAIEGKKKGLPKEIKELLNDMQNPFFSMHKAIIDLIQPKTIFAIGLATYNKIIDLYKDNEKSLPKFTPHASFPSGHGTWNCLIATRNIGEKKQTLIGFPHFSRYHLYNKNRKNVLNWVGKEYGVAMPAQEFCRSPCHIDESPPCCICPQYSS